MLLREFIGVRATSDLDGGRGGGGGDLFARTKLHSARMPEFCNRETKALIFYEKENPFIILTLSETVLIPEV